MADQWSIPVTIVRQGGEQVVIGRAIVNKDGLIAGRVESEALDDATKRTLGHVSFAINMPRRFLRRIVKRGHVARQRGRHEATTK